VFLSCSHDFGTAYNRFEVLCSKRTYDVVLSVLFSLVVFVVLTCGSTQQHKTT